MTPLLCTGLAAAASIRGPSSQDWPAPANAGSAATLIGNPQNIVIGQVGCAGFLRFVAVCALPAIVVLAIVFVAVLARLAQGAGRRAAAVRREAARSTTGGDGEGRARDAGPAGDVPDAAGARDERAAGRGVLLISRRFASRDMLTSVDWPLLVLFVGLFVVNEAMAQAGLTTEAMTGWRRTAGCPTACR